MKILCAYSSLEFQVEHFPGHLHSREACHPIFQIPQKKLLAYLGKWAGSELTPTDSYLLFLSLLKSTDLVEFRSPAIRSNLTESIIAQNMEPLYKIALRLNSVPDPEVYFPHFVISPETKDLANVSTWIHIWNSSYDEFKAGKSKDYENRKLAQKEFALARLIRSPYKDSKSYAPQIAEWASQAGDFPQYLVSSPFSRNQISLREYWKQLIIRCIREESIYLLNKADISELLEHCETTISIGTIHSHALFSALRKVQEKLTNFLGIEDNPLNQKPTYSILSSDTSVEAANMKSLIDSAPKEEPKEINYPTRFKFLQAKLRWDMAQRYSQNEGDSV